MFFSCFNNDAFNIPDPNIKGSMLVEDYLFVSNNKYQSRKDTIQKYTYHSFFRCNPDHVASHFQFPVGPPDATGYYNAQKFKVNDHLGDDWNGVGGGNSDLGDPIFSIANGWISQAKDYQGGWGNVVRIVHKMPKGNKYEYVESMYAHLDTISVSSGQMINIGDPIGTIGNCNGAYLAHLHLEIRNNPEMPIGFGYSLETEGYLDPTSFIRANR